MTVSPRPAYRRRVPPSTRMTSARLAPELSATRTMLSCWIMAASPYRARSTISTTRHRLSFDNGRVSMMRTVSPVFASFCSSCAFTFVERVTILPYCGWAKRRSRRTTTVFCILSLTTLPTRTLRALRASAAVWLVVSLSAIPILSSRYLPDAVGARPGLVRCRSTVFRRAMSLRSPRSRRGSSSGWVAPRKRSRKRSSSSSARRARISASVISRISSACIGRRLLAGQELGPHRDLGSGQRHRLLGDLARDAFELEQHAPGLHHRHPPFRRSLALSHARLGRLLRDRFVREDADPDLAAALDVTRERHARSLDLPVGDPAGLHGLESVGAERNLGPTGRQTLGASLEHLPEFYSLRTKHCSITR